MGEPVKIVDLARDLIELSGLEVGRDIDIVFTSPRPGDKLFEELFINGEKHARTCHEKIFISKQAGNFLPSNIEDVLAALTAAAEKNERLQILACLQQLVPEFQHAALATAPTAK
jgi:FlaA1/EpsC-like NDP-sugar epimerase